MKSFLRFSVAVAVVLSIVSVTKAQYPGGTGTSGATDGSGRGTGSAGVQTGGGPDTSQSTSPQPLNIFAPQSNITATSTTSSNTSVTTTTTSGGEKKQKAEKKSKKAAKQSQVTASPSPGASPR